MISLSYYHTVKEITIYPTFIYIVHVGTGAYQPKPHEGSAVLRTTGCTTEPESFNKSMMKLDKGIS